MELEVIDNAFTNEQLEAFYSEEAGSPLLALQPWLPEAAKRARELEARGYLRDRRILRQHPRPRRIFMYSAETPEKALRITVAALRAVVAEMEPEWVAAVAEARRYADDPRVMAAWCEIPVQAVLASLQVLKDRRAEGGW